MNLSSIAAVSSQWDFADFSVRQTGTAEAYRTDGRLDTPIQAVKSRDGVFTVGPNTSAATWITHGAPNAPQGVYTVTWRGDATLDFGHSWSLVPDSLVQTAPGQWHARVQTGNMNFNYRNWSHGFRIGIINNDLNAAKTISDLRVYAPGHGPGEPGEGQRFHTLFEERLEPFGAIRFMDWQRVNANRVETWADRAKPQDALYGTNRGVPVEDMVELANRTGSDPWFTMPVFANDEYIRNFATYVRDNLDPSLKAYVEYGNEVWGFWQNDMRTMATQRGLHADDWWKVWADEARRDFGIWSDVFGDDSSDRVVRVAAAQTVNRFHSARFYDHLGAENFDAIAIAGYIDNRGKHYDASTTADQIIADLFESIYKQADQTSVSYGEWARVILGEMQPQGDWAYHKAVADALGVPLLAYEGGQHLVTDPNSPWWDAFLEAQRDPRMAEVYEELLRVWHEELGAGLFMAYANVGEIDQWGAWGSLEYQDQDPSLAPKYQGLVNYVNGSIPEPAAVTILGAAAVVLVGRRATRHA